MKFLYTGILLTSLFTINVAQAQVITELLSQTKKSFAVHLEKGDMLTVQYDLNRSPITRASEWSYYALFCHTVGKALVEYTYNGTIMTKKLPVLMSKEEYGQEDIGVNIESTGELKISNLSEFYDGTTVVCGLYDKFGE
jgi:hypothetical protein